MDYNKALEYIHSLPRFSGKAGLERIRRLLSHLGNPQNDLKFIHVAGTNGKGSVCTMLANTLKLAGYRTGLYISPFITCFRERMQINGEYISESELAEITQLVRSVSVEVNEFEFITAVAFLFFKRRGCDVVVLETGLGGRLDATNVINAPICSVITGIGLDHTAVLGETLEEIAREKCGIIKKGSPVFTTYNQSADAMRVISKYPSVVQPDIASVSECTSNTDGNTFMYKGEKYETSLIGEHQIENALLAIEVLYGCGLNINAENIKAGLKTAVFPARLEILSKEPLVLLDGAHNPHGAAALAREMKKHSGITLIIGMMRDKNCAEVIGMLAPLCKKIITVTVEDNPRSLSAEELKCLIEEFNADVTAAQNYGTALALTENEKTVVIAGSLYLAGGIRNAALKFYNK